MSTTIYRGAAFLFSIVCYGVFLLVFLYLLGFLGNTWCPDPSISGTTWDRRKSRSRWMSV